MNKKLVIGIVAIIIIIVAVVLFSRGSTDYATNPGQKTSQTAAIKEFNIHGSNYKFDSASISANLGDKVKITFIDDDGLHNICIDGYGCSSTIRTGQSVLEFTANKTGTFEYYCSVGKHRELGMTGQLAVS